MKLDGWQIDEKGGWWFDRDQAWHVHVPITHADGRKASVLLHVPERMCDDFVYGMEELLGEAAEIDSLVKDYDAVFSDEADCN
jgi:hypothetical protein